METKKWKRLTLEQWIQIKAKYEAGEQLRAMAEEYKIAHTTILRRAKREGWEHGKLRKKAEAVDRAGGGYSLGEHQHQKCGLERRVVYSVIEYPGHTVFLRGDGGRLGDGRIQGPSDDT